MTGMMVSSKFLSDSLENPLPSWAWAYDSIIALGLPLKEDVDA